MTSNKQKRKEIQQKRAAKKAEQERLERERAKGKTELNRRQIKEGLENGTLLPVDPTKVVSASCMPDIPEYYQDTPFVCRDCGKQEVWTARQQKQWYEEWGGEIESVAIRCRPCRLQEKKRRETARRIHSEGLKRKLTQMRSGSSPTTSR